MQPFNVGKFSSSSFFFLDTYSLSMPSLRCKALCIIIKFLVLWSIYQSSSLVHLKNSPDYLTRRTALVLISLVRFLLQSLVLRSFLIHLRYSFVIFLSFLQIFPSICNFPSLQSFWLFPDLAVIYLQLCLFSHISL